MIIGLIVLVFLFSITFFTPSKTYDRIDIIDSGDFRFRLPSKDRISPVGQAYLYSDIILLSIDDIPDELTMHCYQRKSIILKITNHDEYIIKDLQFIPEDNDYITVTSIDRIVIPPQTSKELTFFINSGCPKEEEVVKINQIITIKGTDASFNIPISLYKRLE